MLYERWRQIARNHASETALWDLNSGESWTFQGLDRAAESATDPDNPLVFAGGRGIGFVISLLNAWRRGRVFCPLDTGQPAPEVPPPPPGIAHLKTTSASTGAPRAVAFTGEQLAADAENIVRTMGLRPDWPNLGVISVAHSYGFSNLVLPLLLHGIPLLLAKGAFPETVRQALALRDSVTLPAVPALWRTWHDAGMLSARVRLAISAGAPLPVELEKAVHESSGVKIHNFYGATECGGIAYDASSEPRADANFVGQPMRGVEPGIDDRGCLEVRSRAVGETYWPVPDPALGGGVFRTTDEAELREAGVFLRGRAGDVINVAGRKVAPERIEARLRAHSAVRECVVFGAPGRDEVRAEVIVACVSSADEVTAAGLREFLAEDLAPWEIPREWWFVPGLNANERGKLSRAEWRRRWEEK